MYKNLPTKTVSIGFISLIFNIANRTIYGTLFFVEFLSNTHMLLYNMRKPHNTRDFGIPFEPIKSVYIKLRGIAGQFVWFSFSMKTEYICRNTSKGLEFQYARENPLIFK